MHVGILSYQDHKQLQQLRAQYYQSHVFLRDGPNILTAAVIPDAVPLGDKAPILGMDQQLNLCAALVRNALVNWLYERRRPIYRYKPLHFDTIKSEHNLLSQSLSVEWSCPNWIAVRERYILDVRVFRFDKQPPFIGIAFDVFTTRRIERNCQELLTEGINLRNLYVGRLEPNPDPRIKPHLKLMGKIQHIDGDRLLLTDARPGVEAIEAKDAYLEPRPATFDRCLAHIFQNHATVIKAALECERTAIRTGPTRLAKLREAANYLAREPLAIAPGITGQLGPLFASDQQEFFPPLEQAPKPVYVFDPAANLICTWHDGGLSRFGPYSAQFFDKNRPRICVICQASRKGQVEQFLHKFLHGIIHERNGTSAQRRGFQTQQKYHPHFEKGFLRKYALEDCSVEFFLTKDESPKAYQLAVAKAITWQEERNMRWDLALVQIERNFRNLYGQSNPYLVTKAGLLTHQIPVQEFTIETATLPDEQLAPALNHLALATYAKLGGIPWLLKFDSPYAHELVIGLGSASIGQGRLGSRDRNVGITTVFSADGRYWLSNLTQAVPARDYQEALLETLRDTIMRLQQKMNWQSKPFRLIFHGGFKSFKREEIQAVKTLMKELKSGYEVDHAFLQIKGTHPYLIFDEKQPGVFDRKTKTVKGVLAPNRGCYLRLTDLDVLMALTGPRDVKQPRDGIPHPVLLSLHHDSNFIDMTYLTRQVYLFANHSWRSFFPSPLPVTILYSELIAQLLGKLGTVPRWNPDVMIGRIGRTRWFL